TLLGVSFIGVALRGAIPDFLSIVVANMLCFLGVAALWNGIRLFGERPARWAVVWGAALGFGFFMAYYSHVVNNPVPRIVMSSALLGIGCLLCGYELLRGPAASLRATAVPAAAIFGIVAISLSVRAAAAVLLSPAPTVFTP